MDMENKYLTLEEARSILTELGYTLLGSKSMPSGRTFEVYAAENHLVEIKKSLRIKKSLHSGVCIKYESELDDRRAFHCKTAQQFRWALKICQLEADAYASDWSMCQDVFGTLGE